MSPSRRHVLVIGADREALERVAPMLQRAEFEIHTVAESPFVLDLIQGTSFELLMVSFPTQDLHLDEVVARVRSEGSNCRNAGFLLLADDSGLEEAQSYVDHGVNRAVSVSWAESRLWQVVGDLVKVEPRIFLRALVDIDVRTGMNKNSDLCRTENISASGMLLHGADPYPPGSHFDFVFALPGDGKVVAGTAEIVRYAVPGKEGIEGFGARFVSLRGDGKARLDKFIKSQLGTR